MDDNAPPSDDAEAIENLTPAATEATSLGPAYAILQALVGDRMPKGALGPDNVPVSVLAVPMGIALRFLLEHNKKCHKPRCTHVPAPLWRYSTVRPGTIKTAAEQMYRVLWGAVDHDFVKRVRKTVLTKQQGLVELIAAGELLEEAKLHETLTSHANAPLTLAAVLWATGFAAPESELVFRAIVPIIERAKGGEDSGEDSRVAKQLSDAKDESRIAIRQKKKAERAARDAADKLASREQIFEETQRQLQELKAQVRALTAELVKAKQVRDDTIHDIVHAVHSLEESTKTNNALRQEIRKLQQNRHQLDTQISESAANAALERRRIEQLTLQIETIPTGAEAAWRFLQAEDQRISDNRLISAGGNKQRADDEWKAHRKLETAFLEAYPSFRRPPPVLLRSKVALRLVTLGGSSEVGRSCYLLEIGNRRLLVDCGVKPATTGELYPAIDRLDHIDALLLTHAHTDHIGWVPALINKLGEFDIYCSEGTAALLPIMLEDSHMHYMRRMAHANERAKYIRNATLGQEAYEAEHVRAASKLASACRFDEEETLPFGDIAVRFYPAGHVLGAASVLITDQSGRRIFMSGDFSSSPQLTVPAARWPSNLGEVDLLVMESTYGDRPHRPMNESRGELVRFVRRTLEGGGSVILAAFALGRAQELLSLIWNAKVSGEIPSGPSIHVDGMIKRINPIYHRHANFDLPPEAYIEVAGQTDRKDVIAAAQRQPTIIVTTSGMMTGGPVIEYARQLLPEPRHRLVLAGYQDEGAPSRALRDLAGTGAWPRTIELPDENGEIVRFKAALPACHVSLSSHADRAGLVEYAGRMQPKAIALVHGEPTAQEALKVLLEELHPNAEIACGPDALEVR